VDRMVSTMGQERCVTRNGESQARVNRLASRHPLALQ
jgi:hypothetical protein